MAFASVALMALGTAVSVYGAYSQGQAQSAADQYNAEVQQQNAQSAIEQGQLLAKQDARQQALDAGTIMANSGASGATGPGSALDVLGDVSAQGNLQQQEDQYNQQLKGWEYGISAQTDTTAAHNATSASILSAGSALLGGAARTAGMYNYYYGPKTGTGAPLAVMGF